jgi:hypothetical protein
VFLIRCLLVRISEGDCIELVSRVVEFDMIEADDSEDNCSNWGLLFLADEEEEEEEGELEEGEEEADCWGDSCWPGCNDSSDDGCCFSLLLPVANNDDEEIDADEDVDEDAGEFIMLLV